MFTKKQSSCILLILAVATAEAAFAPTRLAKNFIIRDKDSNEPAVSKQPQQQAQHQHQQQQLQRYHGHSFPPLHDMMQAGELSQFALPGLIYLGSVAASIIKSQQEESTSGLKDLNVAELEEASEAEEVVLSASVPSPVPAAVAPAPGVPEPKTSPVTKPPTVLIQEVASTVEEQKATRELAAARKAAKEKAATDAAPAVAKETVESKDNSSSTPPPSPSEPKKKSRFIIRLLKKIIAPWRKWSNIK